MRQLKIKPICAAKIFGPAFIKFCCNPKYLTISFDELAIRLYFEKSDDLIKKSTARKIKGIML
jgi:hypothetical protein